MAYLLRSLKIDKIEVPQAFAAAAAACRLLPLQVHLATDAGVPELAASVKADLNGAYPASPVFGFVTAAAAAAAAPAQ
eukprot:XP_001701570.1 predicted protein [Chlamydomonas reinhardtii]